MRVDIAKTHGAPTKQYLCALHCYITNSLPFSRSVVNFVNTKAEKRAYNTLIHFILHFIHWNYYSIGKGEHVLTPPFVMPYTLSWWPLNHLFYGVSDPCLHRDKKEFTDFTRVLGICWIWNRRRVPGHFIQLLESIFGQNVLYRTMSKFGSGYWPRSKAVFRFILYKDYILSTNNFKNFVSRTFLFLATLLQFKKKGSHEDIHLPIPWNLTSMLSVNQNAMSSLRSGFKHITTFRLGCHKSNVFFPEKCHKRECHIIMGWCWNSLGEKSHELRRDHTFLNLLKSS